MTKTKSRRVAYAGLLLCLVGLPAVEANTGKTHHHTIVVSDAEALKLALVEGNAGRRIRVLRGTYLIDTPLVVPDGAILEGEGVMRFDADGLPTGFSSATRTTIRASVPFAGDLLALGDRATVRGLIVEDLVGRSGNVVTVASREPEDTVSATIIECEIISPNPAMAPAIGPVGRAVLVVTRNPFFTAPPAPDQEAVISARMARSIVRATNGSTAVFAINFAAGSEISLVLSENVLVGPVEVVAGASRPEQVEGASMTVHSRRNLYLGPGAVGLLVVGGSGVPVPTLLPAGTSSNTNHVSSVDDRIEGFRVGISAAAAKKVNPGAGMNDDNLVELRLEGTTIHTEGVGAADFLFQGTLSTPFPFGGSNEYPAGNRNTLRVSMRDVTGSGPRANVYTNVSGPVSPANFGVDNGLEIAGSLRKFLRSNDEISPAPPAALFVLD